MDDYDVTEAVTRLNSEINEYGPNHWNRLFWALFVVAGIAIAVSTLTASFLADVLLGVLIVAIGVQKIGEELHSKGMAARYRKVQENLESMTGTLENSHYFAKQTRDKHESRFHSMESKRIELAKKIDSNYRDLAGRMIALENTMQKRREETDTRIAKTYRDLAGSLIKVENNVLEKKKSFEK
ncbi:MAG: hypothetical protein HY518_05965, partial [Candidatus Aenigmarchaeota archaeon]|nr:hypothetical protein [Candidatus Aenigmarchaeota archaeon]